MKMKSLPVLILPLLVILMASCGQDYVPKPASYPRIHFPERGGTTLFEPEDCPFQFEIPDYCEPRRKQEFFGEATSDCWGWDVLLPRELNGAIYLTYKTLGDEDDLLKLSEDAHKLTYKHMKRADFIEPLEIAREDGTRGLIYFVGGDAASQIQFFVTDTVSHFLRGTLNFNSRPNADSLAPVVRFVADDIESMLKTLDWQ